MSALSIPAASVAHRVIDRREHPLSSSAAPLLISITIQISTTGQ